ncbi:hypothetical protein P168DRAFT_317542 [Aspergillus campestris IBT 28561]|uniref:Uncharacterized protein n=1 Tax=Aspergillus campestris (strain IBT 28561) TaxID=1392248 RepID=A0A2I1D855_ASPC2|nr:uncharacterized protein P168DRAFT_317542 [Aspergillus campestris IBT 28561]PKY06045.1 hypothetical protein P168DRAFT_317542 [Aspergillus campestris IBT 28561]
MRFISIATTLFLAATALAAGKDCKPECFGSSSVKCVSDHPAVVRQGPGCFKCCKSA